MRFVWSSGLGATEADAGDAVDAADEPYMDSSSVLGSGQYGSSTYYSEEYQPPTRDALDIDAASVASDVTDATEVLVTPRLLGAETVRTPLEELCSPVTVESSSLSSPHTDASG